MTKHRDESDDTSESMSTNESETSGELGTMNVRLKDENVYQVGNPAEGTAYLVNMHNVNHDGTMTCSCPDYRFRAQEGEHRACKHIQRVIQVSPSELTTDALAFRQLVREYEILSDKVDSVMQDLSLAQSNGSAVSQPSQGRDVPASDAAGDGQQMQEITAEEAAGKLREAFPVDGMDVQISNGKVWVNKTPEAPDYTFSAFLQEPSLMQYDPDNGPGQYWKNYIEPEDVEQYISEVLE
jgi:hypothetical protein